MKKGKAEEEERKEKEGAEMWGPVCSGRERADEQVRWLRVKAERAARWCVGQTAEWAGAPS